MTKSSRRQESFGKYLGLATLLWEIQGRYANVLVKNGTFYSSPEAREMKRPNPLIGRQKLHLQAVSLFLKFAAFGIVPP